MKQYYKKIPLKIILLASAICFMPISQAFAAKKAPIRDSNLASLNMSQAQVINWAGSAIIKVLSMNYMNLRKDFSSSSKLFTVKAWAAFSKSLKESGIVDKLGQDKLGMRAIPTDVALIKSQGNVGGNYSWTVNIPVLIVMANKTETITHHWSIDLVVERSPSYIGMDGLAIREFLAKPIADAGSTKKSK